MSRPFVISIAGFDPSAGAGILADIKTFEQNNVYGLGICSAITNQTEDKFHSVVWESYDSISISLETLIDKYSIKAIKIGIVENLKTTLKISEFIKSKDSSIKIVYDPVLKSSTEFDFIKNFDKETLTKLLKSVDIITPNLNEFKVLFETEEIIETGKVHSSDCAILLKGGHNLNNPGKDILFLKNQSIEIHPLNKEVFPKHGSGCVLSSALTAMLALQTEMHEACIMAKKYTEFFLLSNHTLLGWHNV